MMASGAARTTKNVETLIDSVESVTRMVAISTHSEPMLPISLDLDLTSRLIQPSQFGQLFMFWKQFSEKARCPRGFAKCIAPLPSCSQIPKRSFDMAYWDADATSRSFWAKAYRRVARSETLSLKRKQAEKGDGHFFVRHTLLNSKDSDQLTGERAAYLLGRGCRSCHASPEGLAGTADDHELPVASRISVCLR